MEYDYVVGMYVVERLTRYPEWWRLYEVTAVVESLGRVRGELLYMSASKDLLVQGKQYTLEVEKLEPYWLQAGDCGVLATLEQDEFLIANIVGENRKLQVYYSYMFRANTSNVNTIEYMEDYMIFKDIKDAVPF